MASKQASEQAPQDVDDDYMIDALGRVRRKRTGPLPPGQHRCARACSSCSARKRRCQPGNDPDGPCVACSFYERPCFFAPVQQTNDGDGPRPLSYTRTRNGHACSSCRQLKVRCLREEDSDGPCLTCVRRAKSCDLSQSTAQVTENEPLSGQRRVQARPWLEKPSSPSFQAHDGVPRSADDPGADASGKPSGYHGEIHTTGELTTADRSQMSYEPQARACLDDLTAFPSDDWEQQKDEWVCQHMPCIAGPQDWTQVPQVDSDPKVFTAPVAQSEHGQRLSWHSDLTMAGTLSDGMPDAGTRYDPESFANTPQALPLTAALPDLRLSTQFSATSDTNKSPDTSAPDPAYTTRCPVLPYTDSPAPPRSQFLLASTPAPLQDGPPDGACADPDRPPGW